MLDIEKIKQLIEMMVSNDLVEISLRDGEEEVNLRRPGPALPANLSGAAAHNNAAVGAPPQGVSPPPQPAVRGSEEDQESGWVEIVSPMVGTYYASSDPESPPFAKVGQPIQVGMVVCILEAMKVFNEIKSEVAGTIERILVKNAEAVEFGQPLMLVRPS